MLDGFPADKSSGRSIDMGLSLCARPFLKIAVVGGMPILLKVDKCLGNGLQLSGNSRVGRIKLPVDRLF